MASQSSIHTASSSGQRSGRAQSDPHGKKKCQDRKLLSQVPHTPPSMHLLKRRRVSLQYSSPSKAPRQDDQDCVNFDSEGYEIVEPVVLPTPSTVEIFNTSDTERAPTPDPAQNADGEEPCGSDDSQPSRSSGYYTADTSRSSGSCKANQSAAGRGPSTPGHNEPCHRHNACPHCCGEALLKPDFLDHDVPDLSPNTYIYVRNLGLHSPDGSFSEHWANYPVSFIPSTSRLGPHDLDPDHYTCPYPGCIDPFGPCGRPDGYTGRGLALHIFRHHGNGPALDRVRLDLHKRVMTLRRVQGKDSADDPLRCTWIDHGRDLEQATIGLIEDLEEIREWERSRRVVISKIGKIDPVAPAKDTDQPALPEEKESLRAADKSEGKGRAQAVTLKEKEAQSSEWEEGLFRGPECGTETELEAMGSPSSYARTNHFAGLRDNRFQRARDMSLLHLKEVFRTPKKSCARDGAGTMFD